MILKIEFLLMEFTFSPLMPSYFYSQSHYQTVEPSITANLPENVIVLLLTPLLNYVCCFALHTLFPQFLFFVCFIFTLFCFYLSDYNTLSWIQIVEFRVTLFIYFTQIEFYPEWHSKVRLLKSSLEICVLWLFVFSD